MRIAAFILIGLAVGIIAKATFEYVRFRSWDTLEDDVDDWRDSPSGRFHGYLDGLTDTP